MCCVRAVRGLECRYYREYDGDSRRGAKVGVDMDVAVAGDLAREEDFLGDGKVMK